MKLADLFSFFKKKISKTTPDSFSDFFLNAPAKEKTRIFTNAAARANEEQKEIFERAKLTTLKPSKAR